MIIRFRATTWDPTFRKDSFYEVSLHSNVTCKEGAALITITFIHLDDADFVFATDIPSRAFCSG